MLIKASWFEIGFHRFWILFRIGSCEVFADNGGFVNIALDLGGSMGQRFAGLFCRM
jgi:hypothetical protein